MEFTLAEVIEARARWGRMNPNSLVQFINIMTQDLSDQLVPITKMLELPNDHLYTFAADLREANMYVRTNVLAWYHIVDLYRLDVGEDFYALLSKTMRHEKRLNELVKEAENHEWRVKIKAAEQKTEAMWDAFLDFTKAIVEANVRGEL